MCVVTLRQGWQKAMGCMLLVYVFTYLELPLNSLSVEKEKSHSNDLFQASGPQKKTSWRVPSQLPPGKWSPPSGVPEVAGPQASGSNRARALQQTLPPWQTSSTVGPSLPAVSEVSPGLPVPARAARRAQRRGRAKLDRQEDIKVCPHRLRHRPECFVQGQSLVMLLMDKCELAINKLTVEKGTWTLFTSKTKLSDCLLPATVAVRGLYPEGGSLFSVRLKKRRRNWKQYFNELAHHFIMVRLSGLPMDA